MIDLNKVKQLTKHINQSSLADAMGHNRWWFRRRFDIATEGKQVEPTEAEIKALAKLLRVDPDDLKED